MSKTKILISAGMFLLVCLSSFAQTAEELLRYTDLRPGGTARTMAIGGAISALGADYASISSNPAGVAAFRKSEFVLSLGQLNTNIESGFAGENTNTSKGNFNLETLGFIFNTKPRKMVNWKAFNMAFGLNKLANFNSTQTYSVEGNSSILESFAEAAQGRSIDELNPFDTQLAFDLNAIDEDPNNPGTWFTFDDFSLGNLRRGETIQRTGGVNELVFSLGGNFKDKLLLGFTLGAPIVQFEQNRVYSESDPSNNIREFESVGYEESITTSGIGFNLKAGIIYRLSPKIRFGASIHTRTIFSLTDVFSTSMSYAFVDGEGTANEQLFSDELESIDGTFDYALRTPWRAAGGVAVVINKLGFLTAEVEYLDYTSGSFDLTRNLNNTQTEIEEQNLNEEINEIYNSVINLKLGGEFALKKWRLRAGYALNPTAFVDESEQDDFLTFGLGFRGKNIYLDGAWRHSISNQSYAPYIVQSAPQPIIDNKIVQNRIVLTFGYRF